jgi:hypothetical protein
LISNVDVYYSGAERINIPEVGEVARLMAHCVVDGVGKLGE